MINIRDLNYEKEYFKKYLHYNNTNIIRKTNKGGI